MHLKDIVVFEIFFIINYFNSQIDPVMITDEHVPAIIQEEIKIIIKEFMQSVQRQCWRLTNTILSNITPKASQNNFIQIPKILKGVLNQAILKSFCENIYKARINTSQSQEIMTLGTHCQNLSVQQNTYTSSQQRKRSISPHQKIQEISERLYKSIKCQCNLLASQLFKNQRQSNQTLMFFDNTLTYFKQFIVEAYFRCIASTYLQVKQQQANNKSKSSNVSELLNKSNQTNPKIKTQAIEYQKHEMQVVPNSSIIQDDRGLASKIIKTKKICIKSVQYHQQIQLQKSFLEDKSQSFTLFIDKLRCQQGNYEKRKKLLSLIMDMNKILKQFMSREEINQIENYHIIKKKDQDYFWRRYWKPQQVKQVVNQLWSLRSFKIKSVEKQIQLLWFAGKNQQQIRQILQLILEQQLQNFQNDLLKAKAYVQSLCMNNQFICRQHMKNVYYICLSQPFKKDIYLCNYCVDQIKQKSHHINHEIICRQHRKSINYKILNLIKDHQLFLCSSCTFSQQIQVSFISNCHFKVIQSICTNKQCINNDRFKICNLCTEIHQNHQKIKLSKESLKQKFEILEQLNFYTVRTHYKQIIENLKLSPILKMIQAYSIEISVFKNLLESFAICNYNQLQKLIQLVVKQMRNDHIIVLYGMGLIQKVSQRQRRDYLQIFSDSLKRQIQRLLAQMSHSLKQFIRTVAKISQSNKQIIEEALDKKYKQLIDIEFFHEKFFYPCQIGEICASQAKRIEKIYVKKERELTNDELIAKEWQDFKIVFFKSKIQQILKTSDIYKCLQAQQMHKRIELIKDLFVFTDDQKYSCQQLNIDINNLGELAEYKEQIEQLKKLFQTKRSNYVMKQRQCILMAFLVKFQLNSLKTIHIEYNCSESSQNLPDPNCCYSISVFQLFKVIYNNRQLSEVIITGVFVEKVNKFIKLINPSNCIKINQQFALLRNFNSLKSLKLTINSILLFNLKQQTMHSCLQDLKFFIQMLNSLSNITIKINLGKWSEAKKWRNNFLIIWKYLRPIKKIKIQIKGWAKDMISDQPGFSVFLALLEELTSFSEIIELSLKDINISSSQTEISDQKMQKLLRDIFQNNQITHLKIHNCNQFPIFPKITTLRSISLYSISFRRQYDFLSEMIKNNQQLKSVKCSYIDQKCKFDDQSINQLQVLSLWRSNNISFDSISSEKPSNIKHISIDKSSYGNLQSLNALLPKLNYLIYIKINGIDFGHDFVRSLSSPCLEQFHIWNNSKITNRQLGQIDEKWPYLKHITLRKCSLSINIWRTCQFKGLVTIQVDVQLLGEGTEILKDLKSRGIAVGYY